MDLIDIESYLTPATPEEVAAWSPGHAWLAGGTLLYSEPQPGIHTLVDITRFAWEPLRFGQETGLEIAATCTIGHLYRQASSQVFPATWLAAPLVLQCCEALQSSFKIWHEATVGGNLCTALPAGALTSLAVALEATCLLWPRQGPPRRVAAVNFVTGERTTALAPGELLRSIHLPATALEKRTVMRRFSLTQEGRSSVLLIGTRPPAGGDFLLTITAATLRPIQLHFTEPPTPSQLKAAIESGVPSSLYLDDPHGTPEHRRHLVHHFAPQIVEELA